MNEIAGSAGSFGGSAKTSPVAIIICMNESASSPNPDFGCGSTCENMAAAANPPGYGAKVVSSPTMQLSGSDHDALCEKPSVDTSCAAVAALLIGHEDGEAVSVSGASEKARRMRRSGLWAERSRQRLSGGYGRPGRRISFAPLRWEPHLRRGWASPAITSAAQT